uniref:ATP-dependent DNA helicase 2 subunit 1 n=1 Tax=Romanomermis culicivorax TaxID=13658 RepID=A0A915HHZ8_ROMCU
MDIRQNFKEKFGFADSKMDEVLWICATIGLKEGVKRIFVFTNCDNPHKNDLERQRKVQQKVQDLKEQMISIELLPVGNHFSWENFYSQLIYEDDQSVKPNPADRLEELMDRYNLIASAKIPTPLKLDKSTNEEVKTYKTFVDTETGEKLFPFELKRFQTYGGANIAMEQDEIEQLRMLYPPGLTLLGIQHKNFLKPSYYVKQSMFMYPNEANVKGSSALFRCLLERCQAKDMVIICRLIARTNMAPRLVALLPQLEQLDAKGFQDQPPGFHVIFLPFADDVRDLTHKIMHEERPKADDLQIAKAKEIVEKLTIDYDPDTIANPVLQTHYRAIEAFALEREDMEEVADHTKPNNDWISRKAGQAIHEFTRMIFPDDYVPENNAPRKRARSATGATVKKSKNFDEKEEINLEEEAKSNKLHKLTVPILKELCAQNGIKLTATRKADIITQINAHYGV